MDELEYRLRDLDGVTEQVGRLPSADELRRRGDRKRRRQRARLAVATFAVVAVIAGGVTAWLSDSGSHTTGTPTSPATPVPGVTSSSPTASPIEEDLPNQKSDTLNQTDGGQYWIWAPPTTAGKRMLTVSLDDGSLNLSRSSKKSGDLGFRGELGLSPVGKNQYSITNLYLSEEADAYCSTVVEAGYDLEVCDPGDAKQAFTMTKVDGGYTIASETRGQYLMAEGRDLVWTNSSRKATVFAMEAKPS